MQVFHTESVSSVVTGAEEYLYVSGRFDGEISRQLEADIKELPKQITLKFNAIVATPQQSIGYASDPLIYMPDEFKFHIDVEGLGRLAREVLIRLLPLYVDVWEPPYRSLAELRIGGEGAVLDRKQRDPLTQAIREVWALPVQGKIFVFGSDIEADRRAGKKAAIRSVGGLVRDDVSPCCDYFVTNDEGQAELARKAGARQVIDTIVQQVLTDARD